MPDELGYTQVFNALKKQNQHNRPFQVLVSIEYEVAVREIQHWEDLVTGEKKTTSKILSIEGKRRTTPWNPFTKNGRGPYFVNAVESVAKKFRKDAVAVSKESNA
jgi:hypothetical protein